MILHCFDYFVNVGVGRGLAKPSARMGVHTPSAAIAEAGKKVDRTRRCAML